MASPSHSLFFSCEAPLASLATLISKSISPNIRKARQLHAFILTSTPPCSSPFLNNNLLLLYSKCGSFSDARKLFDRMPTRSVVSYNTMISSYSRDSRHTVAAFNLFRHLFVVGLNPNASTFSSLILAAHAFRGLSTGAAIHSLVIGSGFLNNVCVQTTLLGFYSECGRLKDVDFIFSEMVDKDVIAWNSVIFSHVKNGSVEQGLRLFSSMIGDGLLPSNCTFSTVLSACGKVGDLIKGRLVHGLVIKSECPHDLRLHNALLDMYSSCGDNGSAISVFERIEKPDLVSWNSVLAGYSDAGDGQMAMRVFVQLQEMSRYGGLVPDEYTFAAVVTATAALPSICYGKAFHGQVTKAGLEDSVFVGNTLIGMYIKNDEPHSARKLFNSIQEKDIVLWTEMIVGHSRLGEGELSLRYFYYMLDGGYKADSFAFSGALNSSADLAALQLGETIHSMVVKTGYEVNFCVSGSLVDMYAKNGDLEGAHSVFQMIMKPDLKCWNSMIGGFGNHGHAMRAFELFNEMVRQGLQPDHVTYVSLLSACGHCGFVERGRFYWFCMTCDGIMPGIKHYTCMVSMLSRAGLLLETEELIMKSQFESSPEMWRILLSSCATFRNLDMGIRAAERALILEPEDSATYILLSNLYASVGRWDEVAKMRKKIRELMLEKEPGLSWIEIKNRTHVFSADDESHTQIDDCRNELMRLQGNLKDLGTCEQFLFDILLD
ncbi:pentatricopeptide repeat-containing protein At3g50420 [Dioscorea cayenensis subsp. rotundata]|uniref:Pentatricopeptide repeat-containing protein At3g50420 n=1 Tax=Dioscorea cayennensis subsp. rotundata TaxID=55577 RepID=A0AB40CA93_DIOCR|nr:pentatricopeptide repeat-containing protein At3g50420 [Dioscorea cayenensis subsp. rotundata]XP_039135259.1 pentatricopeptide repeat-containing protein At3g50420 [Dioscorea cayenensis subsp. rotundata]XP_039135260.1 pentatricopeptide repeat-containing protein At3g50420 [Dioscorea cayenensis subsp. rotundata]XP_039135261.1 pentatricopeptide repeat-containing protein At3g50420 [Dioscorea cayenensis subsp. rotundata]XP_039135262.1 pentatricopeptide repeat-containing protein At3g50420 [Dioscorea